MYNVIVWGTGACYDRCFNALKFQEVLGTVKILAVTSNDFYSKTLIDGYPFLSKEDASVLDFDYCLVAIDNISCMLEEAAYLRIRRDKLIPLRVFLIPHFDLKKYITLKESNLSIISSNCWGGICYHRLGLEFLSPTINMSFTTSDFIKFVKKLDYYLSLPVEIEKTQDNSTFKKNYPIGLIGDVHLYFDHYTDFDCAKTCWETRKKRVNKNNILVVAHTDSEDLAKEFDSLLYRNKIIFTSFKNNLKSAIYIKANDGEKYGVCINKTASGSNNILDIIAFMNHENDFMRIH